MAFTQNEQEQAANLFGLMKRQLSMGVPEKVVVYVIAAVAGQTAAEVGLERADLAKLLPVMEQGYDGAKSGAHQAKEESSG